MLKARLYSALSTSSVIALLMGNPVSAAVIQASANICIDADCQDVSSQLVYNQENGTYEIPEAGINISSTDGDQVNLTAGMIDPDPFITYGVSVLDSGAPSTFGFSFSSPVAPTVTAPGVVTASISGSVTEGSGGTVVVTPTAPPAGISQDGTDNGALPDEIQVFSLSSDGGSNWINAGVDVGTAFTSPNLLVTQSANYPATNTPAVAGPASASPFDFMRLDLNFMLSGGGDIFTVNGALPLTRYLSPQPSGYSALV